MPADPKSWSKARAPAWCCKGLLPAGERNTQDIERTLLDGRFCEIRMLFYVGKDLLRWIDQCMERWSALRNSAAAGIKYQSFAAYLVNHAPEAVQSQAEKMGRVRLQVDLFPRAGSERRFLGGSGSRDVLTDEFIRHYYRYADQLFQIRQGETAFTDIGHLEFEFEIYASGEYSRMLEREWAEI